tara:strand:- start:62 stop:649 length:588 start_codon:yes stop_codon:yes gene_type:complete
MTAISPLESIHKKGIFGDHHKKNESDLIQISEVKALKIVQVLQYKKSTTILNSIKVDELELPTESGKVISNQKTRILWSAPRTWIVMSSQEDIINEINKKCNDKDFAVTDISHSRSIIQIKGEQTKEVLKKGIPINFNKFKKNECASTVFNGITIIIDFIEKNPDKFNILTLRSFSESFYHHITDASLEFGYAGV